jgi:hypothetical protein
MKISESLFSVPIGKSDPARVKMLADELFEAFQKAHGKAQPLAIIAGDVPGDSSGESSQS